MVLRGCAALMTSWTQMLASKIRREFVSVILSIPVCAHQTPQPQGANRVYVCQAHLAGKVPRAL